MTAPTSSELASFSVALAEPKSLEAAVEKALAMLHPYGVTALALAHLAADGSDPLVLADGWPEHWHRRYFEEGLWEDDPVARHCQSTPSPFFWSEIPSSLLTPAARRVLSLAEDAGFREGFCVPIRTPIGGGGLSLAGQRLTAPKALRPLAVLIAFDLSQRVVPVGPPESKLSKRELEVLRWIAAGKTAGETAVILGISSHTVSEHLKHIRAKLGVANMAHAIVAALRTRQLTL